jgi:hypothetical protein
VQWATSLWVLTRDAVRAVLARLSGTYRLMAQYA